MGNRLDFEPLYLWENFEPVHMCFCHSYHFLQHLDSMQFATEFDLWHSGANHSICSNWVSWVELSQRYLTLPQLKPTGLDATCPLSSSHVSGGGI